LDFEITVSPLAKSDILSILEIEYDSQPEPWTEKAFLEEIDRADSSLLVARLLTGASTGECSPEVAGYICYWVVAGEIQILNLAVRQTLRRRGIAKRLIELTIRNGLERHAEYVTLEVRKSNVAARRLYESFGFEVTGERPDYYGVKKESAILMKLDICSRDELS